MKRISQDEYIAALRIFNRTVSVVAKTHPGYHKKKTLGVIPEFVSGNRWIMFPEASINSIKEGKMSPIPNVYISFHDHDTIRDNKAGVPIGANIGLTFNNEGAMAWLDELFSPKSAPQFMAIVNGLDPEWWAEVSQKIKVGYHESTPFYESQEVFEARSVSITDIEVALNDSDTNRPKHGQVIPQGDVVGAITVFSIGKETSEDTFDDDVAKVFDLFMKVLALNRAKPSRLIPTFRG